MLSESILVLRSQPGGSGIVELLELHHNKKGGDLGVVGDVAGNEDDGSVFPHGPAKGEGDAGENGGQDGRKKNFCENKKAVGSKTGGRLL
jgi:hypothetical protein